jgi:hypothetical protein
MESIPRFSKTGIVIDYYQSAYGPTILIDTVSRQELETIREVFVDLAQGNIDLVNLVNISGVIAMTLDALILRRLNSGKQGDKCLELNKNNKSRTIEFLWSLPSVEWWARVNLTDGFSDAPGHHYLTDEDIDDAIVLL